MTTAKLHTYNECDERPVEMMVGKAMCAYANWQGLKAEYDGDERGYKPGYDQVSKFEAEYQATVRCIGMFVSDSLPQVCRHVVERAKAEFDI